MVHLKTVSRQKAESRKHETESRRLNYLFICSMLSSVFSLPPVFCLLSSFSLLSPAPAFAHKTEVAGDVAGTWHVEPNHNPKAGQPAKVWIALTRKGGQLVPLSKASCRMTVYSQPRKAGDKPLLRPSLQAINAERYRGIPGATVTFPRVGLYQLELNCTPKNKGDFKPFRMKYDVTVAR